MKRIDLFASTSPFSLVAALNLEEWLRAEAELMRRQRGELSTREAHLKAIQEGTIAKAINP